MGAPGRGVRAYLADPPYVSRSKASAASRQRLPPVRWPGGRPDTVPSSGRRRLAARPGRCAGGRRPGGRRPSRRPSAPTGRRGRARAGASSRSTPPESSGHEQRPPSRRQTARRTAAGTCWRGPVRRWRGSVKSGAGAGAAFALRALGGASLEGAVGAEVGVEVAAGIGVASGVVVRGFFTCPRARACFSRSRSRAASSTCSMVAPRIEWERPSRAASSFFTTCFPTLKWTRRSSAVSGMISSRLAAPRPPPPFAKSDVRTREGGTTFGCVSAATAGSGTNAVAFANVSKGWAALAGGGADRSTLVTTILVDGTWRGWSSATSSCASRAERPKKRGTTTARFSPVSTLASSATVERHSRPSRSGSMTSGKSWSSAAALLR